MQDIFMITIVGPWLIDPWFKSVYYVYYSRTSSLKLLAFWLSREAPAPSLSTLDRELTPFHAQVSEVFSILPKNQHKRHFDWLCVCLTRYGNYLQHGSWDWRHHFCLSLQQEDGGLLGCHWQVRHRGWGKGSQGTTSHTRRGMPLRPGNLDVLFMLKMLNSRILLPNLNQILDPAWFVCTLSSPIIMVN